VITLNSAYYNMIMMVMIIIKVFFSFNRIFDFTTCRRGVVALSAAAYIDVSSSFYSILAIIFCSHFDSRVYIIRVYNDKYVRSFINLT